MLIESAAEADVLLFADWLAELLLSADMLFEALAEALAELALVEALASLIDFSAMLVDAD
ncbi:hypothetical protein M3M35_06860 [Fructilactobacillus myrtifloralis]|uniref:Uncharacterized protein n=1 Tax=Fructilactobacillus myrtifloralis TaxID=2940301 RepID=A0ABY5BMU7_9LACO|nr:hypothetical protein [Fructilactobacillus myrtifloralis]USS85002.1 hypothetical protein M3M35_06860 [Fructilactobacillus myrtifloralis]